MTMGGRTLCILDWAREYGLNYYTVWSRLKAGKSLEQALELV